MIPDFLENCDKEQLIDWLRNGAGSSNPDYFHANKAGLLKLQQVPEEYAELLLLLKSKKVESYLELGIGNGGSFAAACYFMKDTLNDATAVDCLAYKNLGIGQNLKEITAFMGLVEGFTQEHTSVMFFNKTTDQFFESIRNSDSYWDMKWDAIFIDASHEYLDAHTDYQNSLNYIADGGLIIFHDINSKACPGIMKLWKEVKVDRKHWEFISSETCGIGVIEL